VKVGAIDAIPEWMRRAGLTAFDQREPDVRVADLELDSLMAQPEPAPGARVLRFVSGAQVITLHVTPELDSVALAIAVTPAQTVAIEVRPLRGQVTRVVSDDRGRAECSAVPAGPLSVLVHWPDAAGGPARSAWVQV